MLQFGECRFLDGSDIVMIKFEPDQVRQSGKGMLLQLLYLVASQVNRIQRMDHFDGIRNGVDSVSEQIQILHIGTVHKSFLMNC